MKTLIIMRHAKSSWNNPGDSDFARPLNERGLRDAPRMGELLAEEGIIPDKIFASSAKRATQTAQLVAEVLAEIRPEANIPLKTLDDLYHASPPAYLKVLLRYADNAQIVLLIGHNPGLEDLVRYLSGEIIEMPTATVVQLSLEVESWQAVLKRGQAKLENVWRPKEL